MTERTFEHSLMELSKLWTHTAIRSNSPVPGAFVAVSASARLRRLHTSARCTAAAKPNQEQWRRRPTTPGGRRLDTSVTINTAFSRSEATAAPESIPYSDLTIGVPRETYPQERRVSVAPQNIGQLRKKGFARVLVERGAGTEAQFTNEAYEVAGATLVDRDAVWSGSDILLKVRAPRMSGPVDEIQALKEGGTVISMIQPAQNKPPGRCSRIAKDDLGSPMDMVPRISRAQAFDVLSSMANIAGYKAVIEASNHFGRFFTGQVTAAGKIPPSKVLVIGAGVAGLSAISTARRMGAIVRGFDTRAAAREQVQSLGAEFLSVSIEEDGAGDGGYGKEMSKEFIDAEMKLFMDQCRDVDIVVTTAQIPGKAITKADH